MTETRKRKPKPRAKRDVVWVVTVVESGVPVLVEAYRDAKRANARARVLQRASDPNDDVVVVFETWVGVKGGDC